METIRLLQEAELLAFGAILSDAYPGRGYSPERNCENISNRNLDPAVSFYGAFSEDQLQAGMRTHNFIMHVTGAMLPVGGVGSVAVDLLHKKERIALRLIRFALDDFLKKGFAMATLYPFTPSFYKRMGFGFGGAMTQYRIRPADLLGGASKKHMVRLSMADAPALLAFYNSMTTVTNGLMERWIGEVEGQLKDPANRVFAYQEGGKIRGYVLCRFTPAEEGVSFLVNDLTVSEILFDSPEVFGELMHFLYSQSDQARYILLNIPDESFRFALDNPLDNRDQLLTVIYHSTSRQGSGIMYRVIDVVALFEQLSARDFGGQTCALKLTLTDNLLPRNQGSFFLQVREGKAVCKREGDFEVELTMDISEFSSLVTGAVGLKTLCKYNRACLSDAGYLQTLHRLFHYDTPPVCLSAF